MSSSLTNKQVCIVGGGPSGLFAAQLLLDQDPTVQVQVLEKAPRDGTPDANAFGFGVGARHRLFLEKVPGLWERIEAVSAATGGQRVRIVGRSTLCREILTKLEETHGARCTVLFDTGCSKIDLDRQTLQTSSGKEIGYDLLIGADGINSQVRQLLVEKKGLQEERYLRPTLWKSMKLPPQPDLLDAGAFKPLAHPSIRGAIFPRYPEGHTALIFWKDMDLPNPKGIETESDLTTAITTALQPKSNNWNLASKLFFNAKKLTGDVKVRFDDKEVARFIQCRPRREHYMKADRYHDGSVALLGDSAHGMYSFLGQGAACGFQSAAQLLDSLKEEEDIASALQVYSKKAVPEGHAITDLNLVTHTVFGSTFGKLMAIPLILFGALRGKLLMNRLNQDIPYRQILRENTLLVWFSSLLWKRERLPFPNKSKSE